MRAPTCTRPARRDLPRARARGLTLLELAIVLAVLAILGALALPSMVARLRSERLHSAAQMLAADIAHARHEAARRGSALHIEARGQGADWCWAVASQAGCDCRPAAGAGEAVAPLPSTPAVPTAAHAACPLKTVPAREHPGVQLIESHPVSLLADGLASAGLVAAFAAGEQQLQVHLSRFGRARICDPAGASAKLPKC